MVPTVGLAPFSRFAKRRGFEGRGGSGIYSRRSFQNTYPACPHTPRIVFRFHSDFLNRFVDGFPRRFTQWGFSKTIGSQIDPSIAQRDIKARTGYFLFNGNGFHDLARARIDDADVHPH